MPVGQPRRQAAQHVLQIRRGESGGQVAVKERRDFRVDRATCNRRVLADDIGSAVSIERV